MALPRILLIDDNKTRVQQMEAVFQFMDCSIEIAGSEEYTSYISEIGQLSAIFVGDGIDKLATVVSQIVEWGQQCSGYFINQQRHCFPGFDCNYPECISGNGMAYYLSSVEAAIE